jgi:flagellum-specific peptidoglycan hydrolase FlgJ
MTRLDFLRELLTAAESAQRAGSPIHPQAATAHAANESAFGASGLAQRGKNLFGIKAVGVKTPYWDGNTISMPTWEVIDGKNVTVEASFRAYDTWMGSLCDYGDIIRRVYPSSVQGAGRDLTFLAGLFLTGPRKWATDPAAFDKCARILAQYADTLYANGDLRHAETLVLHNMRIADRWVAISRNPVVLRGEFEYRVRGGKIDLRVVR